MLDSLYSLNAKRILVVSVIIVMGMLAMTNLLVISVLIAASLALSFFVGQFNIRAIGIELVTFITVLSSLAYGPAAGAVLGLALMTVHIAIPHYSGAYVAWVIPEYALAAFLAGALSGGAASIGITVALALNSFNLFMTFLTYKQNLGKYLPYAVTNVLFNALLFSQAGEFVLGLMK